MIMTEEVKMTFKPLAGALAEFYTVLLAAGMDERYAYPLVGMVLADVLKDGRWKEPPIIRFDPADRCWGSIT